MIGLGPTLGLSTSIAAVYSRTRPVLVRGLGSLFTILGSLLIAGSALANNFTVDTFLDDTDTNLGDGVCNTARIGCSLRAAIQEANALGGAHTITLPPGSYELTIPGDDGPLNAAISDLDVVGTKVTIYGSGADVTSISGNQLSRLFHVFTDAQLELCDLTLIDGSTAGDGGGILNLGILTVTNSRIEENQAGESGGGIANLLGASLSVVGSTVLGNTAAGGGGGILNSGEATILRTEIKGNSSESGGGISNVLGSSLTLIASSVSQNMVGGNGGGISNTGSAGLVTSTTDGNHGHDGGGVFNGGGLGIINSTISNNHADVVLCSSVDPCSGGGILNSPAGLLQITNTTIVENVSLGDGLGSRKTGGILNFGIASVGNTIVAHNIGGNCAPVSPQTSVTAVTSNGYNMEDVNDCAFTATGDLVNTPPLLGPLADNGGATDTHALLTNSPAIDAAVCLSLLDQRGFLRPAPCDIGSYEKGPLPDLALIKWAHCEPIKIGGRLVFELGVTNFGDAEDPAVELIDPLPAGLEVTLVQTSQGACRTTDVGTGMVEVACDLGSLPPDGSAEVRIETIATIGGEFTNEANVTGSLGDTNPANDVASVTVVVGPQCGDGILDSGEQCDDGNTAPGGCCAADCTFEPSGSACSDQGVECLVDDACDGEGVCVDNGLEPDGTPCTDTGLDCWIAGCEAGVCIQEHTPEQPSTPCADVPGSECADPGCDGTGTCVPGHLPVPDRTPCGDPSVDQCDDADSCLAGACDPNFVPSGTICDDGAFCTLGETCDGAGFCGGGSPNSCADGVGCTDDSCDEVNDACVNAPNDAHCDNGAFCDGSETCDAVLDCQAGTPPVTDDGVGCTDDSCDEVSDVVVNAPNDAQCDNGAFCDGSETCDAVLDCQAGTLVDCDDADICTDDSCDPLTGQCLNTPIVCSDQDACTEDFCDSTTGQCQSTPVVCDDDDPCTTDSCDSLTGQCQFVPDPGTACDDGDLCTEGDLCVEVVGAVACQGTPVTCDDGDLCTTDRCDPSTGQCGFFSINCDDRNVCTADACDPVTGQCLNDPIPLNEVKPIGFVDQTTLRWSPTNLFTTHWNTYQGTIPAGGLGTRLPGPVYDQVCHESDDAFGDGPTTSTIAGIPPLGTAWYFEVTEEGVCGEGPFCPDSAGAQRPNASPCPTPP
jgi:CSLREA domain-containing protein